jgi:hypothetical protein
LSARVATLTAQAYAREGLQSAPFRTTFHNGGYRAL